MRVVLDTNIFISSVLGGKLSVIIDEWKAGKFKLIVSEAIAREYLDVINRPKFKIPQIEIVTATEYLLQNAEEYLKNNLPLLPFIGKSLWTQIFAEIRGKFTGELPEKLFSELIRVLHAFYGYRTDVFPNYLV